MVRSFRRGAAKVLRAAQAGTRLLGGLPWKIERFNRLIEAEIAATAKIVGSAETVVGIPFHSESGNIGPLTRSICRDLEGRGERAAIVIVSERKTKHLLSTVSLQPSTDLVTVVAFAKPFGFAQRPGLARRSWSHWAILRVAERLSADVIFIDADVRNADCWVHEYLGAIRERRATIAVANYVRDFGSDDGLVHVWDSLIFGALFKTWIAFRHGGDYAVSRTLTPELLRNPRLMRERAYTMDSAVMRLAAQQGARIEHVWLGEKIHAPITPDDLFNRLPVLVESVFDDVATHLQLLVKLHRRRFEPEPSRVSGITRPMRDLIGDHFRTALARDQATRFQRMEEEIRRQLGSIAFKRLAAASASAPELADVSPKDWAKATLRFLKRYLGARDQIRKSALAKAYVPVLQLGILGFLNRTYSMSYREAVRVLEEQYLPAFEQAWSVLAHRMSVPQFSFLRKCPIRFRRTFTVVFRRVLQH